MQTNQLNIELKDIRAIKNANIILDGITVIAGENGCGKSTISKLCYHLLKTSVEFEQIIDHKVHRGLEGIFSSLKYILFELDSYLEKEEHTSLQKLLKNTPKDKEQLEFLVKAAILQLTELFEKHPDRIKESPKAERLKKIVRGMLPLKKEEENLETPGLLSELNTSTNELMDWAEQNKDARPVSILNNALDDAFYDNPLPDSFNILEYGVPIINRAENKLIPIHSIQQVTYIDTPMMLGLNPSEERTHWEDLEALLSKKPQSKSNQQINSIFKDDILNGDVKVENKDFSKDFVYKRADGREFNLLECATGLKSFSILQILYKNGFLTDKTLLIIDEPEVHLHPQWVVEYARLIVLLNKEIGVKFLIASHHPDMISAIKYISEKEESSSNLHFYLAQKENNESYQYDYIDLGVEIDDIFASFNIAFERIDQYGATE